MPVRNPIEAIVASLPGQPISFLYGTAKEVNTAADNVTVWPLVCLYPLMPIGLTLGTNGSTNDDYSLYMEFRTQTKFELNSSDNEDVVNAMLLLAKRFLVAMELYIKPGDPMRYFKFAKGFKATAIPIYNKNDVNDTGVSLSFKVETRADDYLLPC